MTRYDWQAPGLRNWITGNCIVPILRKKENRQRNPGSSLRYWYMVICATSEKMVREKANIEFVHGIGRRRTSEQCAWEKINDLLTRWEDYEKKLFTMGNTRNSYSKTDSDATFMRRKEDHMRTGSLNPVSMFRLRSTANISPVLRHFKIVLTVVRFSLFSGSL